MGTGIKVPRRATGLLPDTPAIVDPRSETVEGARDPTGPVARTAKTAATTAYSECGWTVHHCVAVADGGLDRLRPGHQYAVTISAVPVEALIEHSISVFETLDWRVDLKNAAGHSGGD